MSKTIGITSLVLSAICWSFAPVSEAHAGGYWHCDSAPVQEFWEEDINLAEVSGRGHLCQTPYGLWSSMKIKGLTEGNAYTVWWIYIDDPGSCVNFPLPQGLELPDKSSVPFDEPAGYASGCGLADFFTTDSSGEFLNPLVVYGRMDSAVTNHHRRTRFNGELRSFTPSPGSQVWMLVFGHGPAKRDDKRELARQLLTPEDPLSGMPHLGIAGRNFGYPAAVVVFDIP